MTREKRLVIMLAIASLLVAFGITVIYRVNASQDGRSGSKPRIAVVLKSIDYSYVPFWQKVKDGVVLAAKDYDVDFTILGPLRETQVDEQIRIVQDVILTKPDAIVLAADDYDRLVPVAKEIEAAHIPLVTIDSFINSNDAETKIGTDNIEAGKKAGAALMEYLSPGSQVVIMSFVQGTSTAIDRESGVRAYLQGKAEILKTVYSSADSDIAYDLASQLLRDNPNVKGIVALNDPTTIGAARALRDSGRTQDVVLIGFDNSQAVLEFVEAGIVRATIVQRPFNMGYLGVQVALDLIKGKKVDSYIDTGSQVITHQNMLLPENQKLLFPVTK